MKIGVLALQGAFAEHIDLLKKLSVDTFEIRKKEDLINSELDGLIIPGGESTVIGKLLRELDILEPIQKLIEEGLPVFGTCAGLILLAKSIANDNKSYLSAIDINALRNAYGRQLGSFETISEFKHIGPVKMTFIRAPYIEAAGDEVEVLAIVNEKIVAARQGNILVTAFHPELTEETHIHKFFIEEIVRKRII
ncbi:pyridoxal 5'-phosphate synthase glutaminase subunit PdxT [Clostridium cellulovorans]|uniref:Pyridoxal 5'-phosphate synthase subunit PdxT n=1 Tax=Clostridium cellulovorans (strain ATCC 35296 / DSM 3052 / OCM 3 / 743B) TaxID=573061 RepID=D9SRG2_CLOC7|nr:pyridoxal 5'-phosphate synthase glutaminase subunit PdxT [Clostridium cellulovorans]ADL52391.1 SNO glutamine amidotransferase [Clostridium cellulovorans 743B]